MKYAPKAGQPVQNFAFGGIANPVQRAVLRASDRSYLDARQAELDAFEKQRQEYNTALQQWQTGVYQPYQQQVQGYNAAAQQYNTDVYQPYQQQVNAYNAALEAYNRDVYDPYVKQYGEYEQAINAWNQGPRTTDYAGPAAPTLASTFDMAAPVAPSAFSMSAPGAPTEFSMVAPTLPFDEAAVAERQRLAASRAQEDAQARGLAIEAVANPDKYNFGSKSVSARFMAEGGPVDKSASQMMQELAGQVASAGRGGDEMLAYLSPSAAQLLKEMGGAGTVNPATGLPEYRFNIEALRARQAQQAQQAAAAQAVAPQVSAADLARDAKNEAKQNSISIVRPSVPVAAAEQLAALPPTPVVQAPVAPPPPPTPIPSTGVGIDRTPAPAAPAAAPPFDLEATIASLSAKPNRSPAEQAQLQALLNVRSNLSPIASVPPAPVAPPSNPLDINAGISAAGAALSAMSPAQINAVTSSLDRAQRGAPAVNPAPAPVGPNAFTPDPVTGITPAQQAAADAIQQREQEQIALQEQRQADRVAQQAAYDQAVSSIPVAAPAGPSLAIPVTPPPAPAPTAAEQLAQLPAAPVPTPEPVAAQPAPLPTAPEPTYVPPSVSFPEVAPAPGSAARDLAGLIQAPAQAPAPAPEPVYVPPPVLEPVYVAPPISEPVYVAPPVSEPVYVPPPVVEEVPQENNTARDQLQQLIEQAPVQPPPQTILDTILAAERAAGPSYSEVQAVGGPVSTVQAVAPVIPSQVAASSGIPQMTLRNPPQTPARSGASATASLPSARPSSFGSTASIPFTSYAPITSGQPLFTGNEIRIANPEIPMIGGYSPVTTGRQQEQARNAGNYFALTPRTSASLPGTVGMTYDPTAAYRGQTAVDLLRANPNLSPMMLGGMDSAGIMTDRLGNQIYSPGFGLVRAFSEGGEVEDEDELPRADNAGTAQDMLGKLDSIGPKRVRRQSMEGGASGSKEMTMSQGSLTTAKDLAPKAPKSAKAELEQLARKYKIKQRQIANASKGFGKSTFGAPTLEQPTLTGDEFGVKRFQKGGEAKKSEGAQEEDLSGPITTPLQFNKRQKRGQISGDLNDPNNIAIAELLRKLGTSVARGVPQAVTGMVDLAALPLTASGKVKPEDAVGSTAYLTARNLLPSPQEGPVSESAELLSSMASPSGAAKAVVLGGGLGIKALIDAARRSTLFKDKGLPVPKEEFSAQDMLRMLEEQGIDTGRTWIRGKKEHTSSPGTDRPYDYDLLEYLYSSRNDPDAVEKALREAGRSRSSAGRTISRQSKDRDNVTKFNTKGGVWLTESPTLAETYTGEKGYMIPVYTPKPDVVLNAKGEQWDDFYRQNKDWQEAFKDPNIRLIEVQEIIDAGPHWTRAVPPNASEEELRAALTATNLFAKKPFEKRIVNKMTGEPYDFKHGGPVKRRA